MESGDWAPFLVLTETFFLGKGSFFCAKIVLIALGS